MSATMPTLSVKRQLEILTLPPAKQRRILAMLGRAVQKKTRVNIRDQRDIHGKSFVKRSENSKPAKRRKKLLGKIGRQQTQRVSSRAVTITFKGIAANIATKHQYGDKEKFSISAFKRAMKLRNRGEEYYDKPATKEQAGALVKQLGYKRVVGKKAMRVSQRWIRNNMTIGQAGAIIKTMRVEKGLPERSGETWTVETPARPFFGGDEQWINETIFEIFNN